jgi:hypothetical protein
MSQDSKEIKIDCAYNTHISYERSLWRAAEYLVLADLILNGYKCFPTDQSVNYDLIVEINNKLIRLNVKSTLKPRKMNTGYKNVLYGFHCRRRGKGGKRIFNVDEFDGFALVALDTKTIGYLVFDEKINKEILLRDKEINYKHTSQKTAPYIQDLTLEKFIIDIGNKHNTD